MKSNETPKFLSVEFHARFFPALLRSSAFPRERGGTGFSSIMELPVMLALSIVLVVIGIPSALSRNSIIGWTLAGTGMVGMAALFIHSIMSARDGKPSYENFLSGIFFFFVVLGVSAGIFIGKLQHSLAFGISVSAAGLIAGYLIGIAAGLWLQYLGWIASFISIFSGIAILGIVIVDFVVIFGSVFGRGV